MIVKDNVLSKLKESFDLNLYEAKLWTAILCRGMATAGELSEVGDVPRSRAYDILDSLERKGFIQVKPSKPLMYTAIEPGKVVENSKKLTKKKAAEIIKELESISGTEILNEIKSIYSQGYGNVDNIELTGILKGRQRINCHMHSMVSDAKKSVCIMSSSSGVIRKMELLGQTLEELKKKGVRIRVATQVNKESAQVLKDICKVAEVKHAKGVNSRFCIVDDKNMVFMLTNDSEVHPNYDAGIWIGTPFFVNAMNSVFDMAWDKFEDCDVMLKKLQ